MPVYRGALWVPNSEGPAFKGYAEWSRQMIDRREAVARARTVFRCGTCGSIRNMHKVLLEGELVPGSRILEVDDCVGCARE